MLPLIKHIIMKADFIYVFDKELENFFQLTLGNVWLIDKYYSAYKIGWHGQMLLTFFLTFFISSYIKM